MNKNVIAVIVIGVLATAGVIVAAYTMQPEKTSNNDQSATNQTENKTETTKTDFVKTNELSKSDAPKYLTNGAEIRGQADATGQKNVIVEIGDEYFSPTLLTVSVGTTVKWVNTGRMAHTVTSDDGTSTLDSEMLQQNDSYSYTFDKAGEYNYLCTPHPIAMKGVVKVVE